VSNKNLQEKSATRIVYTERSFYAHVRVTMLRSNLHCCGVSADCFWLQI